MDDDEQFDLSDPTSALGTVAPRSRALELLPPRTRVIFLTKAFRMPVAHAARVLGISRKTFYEHLHAARETLTRQLAAPLPPLCSLCRERPRGDTGWCLQCHAWYERAKDQMQARRRDAARRAYAGHE